MKKSIIIKGLVSIALVFGASSCSSDYLDLEPVSNESSEQITDNVSKMRAAIFGGFERMNRQYSSYYEYNCFIGESTVNMYYGEIPGQDLFSYYGAARYGEGWINWRMMSSYRTYGSVMAWMYYYGLVSQANYLTAADTPDNEEITGEYAFRLAQAYTLRAHAYTRLHQLYGPRWQDSLNGARHSVVIRTTAPDPAETAKDVSSSNEVFQQIYDDLDRAIELYELSGFDRENMWETNISVAYGLYARAALIKEDWATAEEKAKLAAADYEIMSASDYESGFNAPTSEWMWCSQEGYTGVYYASFGAWWACNGAYPCSVFGKYGAGSVDYTFYKQMQNTHDVRCELFYTPDKEGRSLRAKFWNPDDCAEATMNVNINSIAPGVQAYSEKMYDKIGKKNNWIFPYNNDYTNGSQETATIYVPFGAQFKYWGTDTYSSSAVCFMRSSEMLLIQAEAACHNGNYSVAQDCLEKINKNRISNYTKTTKTGDDLLAEVKLNRRWELWGEGFNWFDLKRWGEPVSRVAWKAGDVNSGNWPEMYAKTLEVDEYDGWVYPIPYSEIDYNEALTISVNNPDYGL